MNHQERVFYSHLTSVDSLDVIALEGFTNPVTREVLPSQLGRDIVEWALKYYFDNGRKVAPTREAIEATWGDDMEAAEIEIDDDIETDSVEWAIEKLRAEYARWRTETLLKEIATAINDAPPTGIVDAVMESGQEFYLLTQALSSKRRETTLGMGLETAVQRHQAVADMESSIQGLTFGWPLFDEHMLGVRPGELCIVAGFSGVGKSWTTLYPLVAEWRRQRRSVLFTLENDLDMTFDRMACVLAKVSYEDWQRGDCDESEVARVLKWAQRIKESDHQPVVLMPPAGEADPISMVRKAQLLHADSMIVDQLSHIEDMPGGRRRQARHEQMIDITSGLSKAIKDRDPIPCVLMHQIKREGHDRARKTGRYVMEDMAETSRVEREASHVLAIYQSDAMAAMHEAELQELKLRRGRCTRWKLRYRLEVGDIRVESEVTE